MRRHNGVNRRGEQPLACQRPWQKRSLSPDKRTPRSLTALTPTNSKNVTASKLKVRANRHLKLQRHPTQVTRRELAWGDSVTSWVRGKRHPVRSLKVRTNQLDHYPLGTRILRTPAPLHTHN